MGKELLIYVLFVILASVSYMLLLLRSEKNNRNQKKVRDKIVILSKPKKVKNETIILNLFFLHCYYLLWHFFCFSKTTDYYDLFSGHLVFGGAITILYWATYVLLFGDRSRKEVERWGTKEEQVLLYLVAYQIFFMVLFCFASPVIFYFKG